MGGLVKGVTDAVGLTSSDDEAYMKKAAGLTKGQMARLDAIDLPDIEKMKLVLESPDLVGLLDAEELGPSQFDEISLDPRLQDAQYSALEGLSERAEQGFAEEDLAMLRQSRRDEGARAQSQQQGILQGMAQRGQLDSGAQLAAQLSGQQASAGRAAEAADRQAIAAAQARRQAMTQQGNMAAQMQGADFSRQGQKATAADAISKFNTANRQNVSGQNLAARQQQENQRAGLANQQQMYNKGLEQQQFSNKMTKAGAQGQAAGNLANQYTSQAGAVSQGNAATMGGLASIGTAAMMSDINLKENIEKPQSDEIVGKLQDMLDQLTSYKYDYKEDEGLPEGEQMGVMAQDLEKSELGQEFVEEVEGDKMVDYGKMASTTMAAVADIHERLKRLEGE